MNTRRTEKGQAMPETALFATLAILLAFVTLSLISQHRVRAAATAAAYACAQFISQSPNPEWAAWQARQVAEKTLGTAWSALVGVEYEVAVYPPSGPAQAGGCIVRYRAPLMFNVFGLAGPSTGSEWFVSRAETWKARWR